MPKRIMDKRKLNYYAVSLASILIALGALLVYSTTNEQDHSKIVTHQVESTLSDNITITTEVTQAVVELDPNLKNDLPTDTIQTILTPLVNLNYQDHLIQYQPEILTAIQKAEQSPETLGYLFFPKKITQQANIKEVNQLDIPLLLQKDPAWSHLAYGTDGSKEIAENGCAIITLAMLQTYLSNNETHPQDILNWSGDRYYLHNQGTSWNIFYDFALANNYEFNNYGNDFYTAMTAVQEGKPVVASVNPGYFTEVGHILVIRGYKDGMVYVNDPNDDLKKMHSVQPIPEAIFLAEGANYWSFSN